MANKLMTGMWRHILKVPPFLWEKQLLKSRDKLARAQAFMTAEHRSVHHFAVVELPRIGSPMAPEFIAEKLGLAPDRVTAILDDLEKHMTFLVRNPAGEVTWAYPVTVDKTPHRVTFDTGETLHAA